MNNYATSSVWTPQIYYTQKLLTKTQKTQISTKVTAKSPAASIENNTTPCHCPIRCFFQAIPIHSGGECYWTCML